jgi:Ca2+-binding RTX toxin-like protein
MRITVSIAAAASLLALAALGTAAAAGSTGADLRVVGPSGQLDDITQYSDTTSMPTSPRADCFGPGSGGSGQAVTVQGANALGIVVEAAKSRNQLNPLLLTDTFVPQGFGLGVCGIGGFAATGSAFWYTKVNHAGLQVGGSQFPIHAGDQVLWYLAPNFPPPPELVLNAPVRQPVGASFPVQVLAYADDGTATPAAGAVISGSGVPVTTDASGNALVGVSGAGSRQIQATLGADIPSAVTQSCSFDTATECPAARGRVIVGSDTTDEITGTAGNDQIKPRAGNDLVRALAGDDRIDVRGGGKDRVNCGGGTDSVKADKRDKLAKNCEQRSRGGKKHKHGKHQGKGKKR